MIDSHLKFPLEDAIVEFENSVRSPGNDGAVIFYPLRRDSYELEVKRTGYEPWSGRVEVPPPKRVNVELHSKHYRIGGSVTDERGGWLVEHGEVRITGYRHDNRVTRTRKADLSRNEGEYEFDNLPPIPDGKYRIVIDSPGYENKVVDLPAPPPGSPTRRDVALERIPTELEVVVTSSADADADGNPAHPGRVKVELEGVEMEVTEGVKREETTTDGLAGFEELLPGEYNVRVHNAYLPHSDQSYLYPENKTVRLSEGMNRVKFDLNPIPGSAEVCFEGKKIRNGKTAVETIGDAEVRLNLEGENVSKNAIGIGPWRNYVVRPSDGEINPRYTSNGGTLKYTLPAGKYGVQGLKVVKEEEYSRSPGFPYFYKGRRGILVLPGKEDFFIGRMVPSWIKVKFTIMDRVHRGVPLKGSMIEMIGDGWTVQDYPRGQLPEWEENALEGKTFGGERIARETDATGFASAIVPRDNYTIEISREGYEGLEERELIAPAPFYPSPDLLYWLAPTGGSITKVVEQYGPVYDEEGNCVGCDLWGEESYTPWVYSEDLERFMRGENLPPGRYKGLRGMGRAQNSPPG